LLAAAATAANAVRHAVVGALSLASGAGVKRPLESSGEQGPAPKKPLKIIRCNACMLHLGVVRLKSEHVRGVCPAKEAAVKDLQLQAKSAMGWAASREFSAADFVAWFVRAKAEAKGKPVPGPVKELAYTAAALTVDKQLPNLRGLSAAVEAGLIKMAP
jgi:hypothetical protein